MLRLWVAGFFLLSPPAPAPSGDSLQLFLDQRTGTLRLEAKQVPLSAILGRLQSEYRIRVVAPNAPDVVLTKTFKDVPLNAALDELIRGPYWIVAEGGDLLLPASSGKKTPLPADARPPPAPPPPEPRVREAYGALELRLSRDALAIDRLTLREGQPPPEPALGDFAYTVTLHGRVVGVGSFDDPFQRHVHFPDPAKPHALVRATTGTARLTLPRSVLDEAALSDLRIEIFRVAPAAPAGARLSLETLPALGQFLHRQYVIEGASLREHVKGLSRQE